MSKDLYDALSEVMDSWGLCSICDAEHAWANVKCDLQGWCKHGSVVIYGDAGETTCLQCGEGDV